ncbi:MAG: radical SAM protein [Desulfitobacteriaceae bacterium]
MSRYRVLLITPPYHAGVVEAAGRWPNLGFIYLAGHIREAGFAVQIYDAMTKGDDLEAIQQKIKEYQPHFVATTGYTSSVLAGLDVLKKAKEVNLEIVTVLGGIHATFMYAEILTQHKDVVDFVVRGEGEETLPALLKTLILGQDPGEIQGIAFWRKSELVVTAERPFCSNLDALISAWDLVDWEDYTFFVLPGSRLGLVNSSRGCTNHCSFCSQQKFWQRSYRSRRPEAFVAELEYLRDVHGVNVVMLSDEYPTRERQRWEEIINLLIERRVGTYLLLETCVEDIIRDADILEKYRRAGVVHVYVGVESTDPARLVSFKKNIKVEQSKQALQLLNQAGIISECSFVLGMPNETKESIRSTLELADMYNPDFAHFLHITPWPYADIYDELRPNIEVYDYAQYNFTMPIIKPDDMSRAEIARNLLLCYRDYYMKRISAYSQISDPFKHEYMMRSLQVMFTNSFLMKDMDALGEMPKKVREILEKIPST